MFLSVPLKDKTKLASMYTSSTQCVHVFLTFLKLEFNIYKTTNKRPVAF